MAHSVGEQAERAVRKSQKSKSEDRTPEQILKDIRNSIPGKLHILTADIAVLLGLYDNAADEVKRLTEKNDSLMASNLEAMQGANAEIERLRAQNEEFRSVYEAENRRSVVTMDRNEDGEKKASVSVETPGILGPAAVATATGAVAATEA
jgi:hypothetical protein